MIIVPKTVLPFLLSGREIQVVLPADKRVFKRGRHYAAGLRHNHTICRVEILKSDPNAFTDAAGHKRRTLTIRHAQDQHTPRLLGKKGGYVSNPSQALPNEPEAIDEIAQRRYSDAGRDRDREVMVQRVREAKARFAEGTALMHEALGEARDPHLKKAVRAIEHQVSSIARTLDQAA